MFSHLHLHTEYSLLGGATRLTEAIAKARQLGMPGLAITDYGNVFGAVEFFVEAEKNGIKPVLGCELFLPSYDNHERKQYRRGQDFYWHIVLLVQNKQGYLNLSQLITQAYLKGFYYKPRVDTALLRKYAGGLIALSGGFNSEINHHLYHHDLKAAIEAAKKYAEIFRGRYYLELQDNGLDVQVAMNRELIAIARQAGLPLVATNDVHYLNRDDAEAFEVLRGIQLGRTVTAPQDHLKFSTDGYYLKSVQEMQAAFSDIPEALKATEEILNRCEFRFKFGHYHLPRYQTPQEKTLDEYLNDKAREGLTQRWEELKTVSRITDADRPRYEKRLEHELAVIQKMGFSGYFLIVADFINWAKDANIPVGPGRGSGAGSLVAYSLRITDLDPLAYNLLFERFLNPERVSMPDFDVDFCQDRRGEVIAYVTEKYKNVSQIITFGKMKARAVIRDVGRVMDLEYGFVDKIAKLVPNTLNIKLADALEQEPDLKALYESDDRVRRLIDTSLRLEGVSRHASVHAAGVIISDKPLWHFVPLYKGSRDDVVIQFDMKSAEKIGLIKFDFLGLKTLTVIQKAVTNVKKAKNVDIDIIKIPLDDPKVYENLSRGDGIGVFQLESAGMRDLMARLKPSCFEDIIALVALYRPGPMDLIPDFIERKHGRQRVDYLDERLESVLAPTYGIMVYQEQVMQIAQILGGYTLGGADLLRRAMGKKNAEEMAAQREIFRKGAQKNGLSIERADQIFALMEKFAGYGFNKSHAAAYALISYQTAWLKTHHVTEYMAALMSTEMEDTNKILVFISDCKQHGIRLLAPHVNNSEHDFTVTADKQIRYGLGALKGMGKSAIESIVAARKQGGPFKSFYDFCVRVDLRRVTKKVIEVLIKAGAFDTWGFSRKALYESIDKTVEAALTTQKNESLGQSDLFLSSTRQDPAGLEVPQIPEWSQKELLGFEKEVFGFYFSGHPLEVYESSLAKLVSHNTGELKNVGHNKAITLGGTILSHRTIHTRKGDKMAFAELEDLRGTVEVIVFSKTFKKYGHLLNSSEPLIVKGTVDHSDEGVKIISESLALLSEQLKETTRSIHLHIPYDDISSARIKQAIDTLKEYPGKSLIYFHLKKDTEYEALIEMPHSSRAMACEALEHRLNQLFDGKVVRFS